MNELILFDKFVWVGNFLMNFESNFLKSKYVLGIAELIAY